MIAFGDNWFAFSFWWAFFAAYVFLAVKVKYDDPIRSMRDILAQQVEQKESAAKMQQVDKDQESMPGRESQDPKKQIVPTNKECNP